MGNGKRYPIIPIILIPPIIKLYRKLCFFKERRQIAGNIWIDATKLVAFQPEEKQEN